MDFSKIKALIDTMPKRGIPFFELIVTKDNEEVFNHRVGFSDIEQRKPFESNDLFWLFSASKVITCVAAMRLIDEEKLNLSDPVYKFLPNYANLTVRNSDGSSSPCKAVMTVEHLFTMTAGIGPDHESKRYLKPLIDREASTVELADFYATIPLYFEPGTRYQYGFCHDVLGAVVEIASGMKLSEYVHKYILDPLGMKNTGYRPTKEQAKRLCAAYRYDNSNGTSVLIPTENPYALTKNYDSGGAGLFSCGKDYIKLISALANGGVSQNGYRILSEAAIKKMEVNRLCPMALSDFVNGRLHGYGWGLCGRVHINPVFSLSKSSIGEFGWDGAGGCFAAVDRKKNVSMFFGMQVHNCSYSYIILQPLIRTLVYEALGE